MNQQDAEIFIINDLKTKKWKIVPSVNANFINRSFYDYQKSLHLLDYMNNFYSLEELIKQKAQLLLDSFVYNHKTTGTNINQSNLSKFLGFLSFNTATRMELQGNVSNENLRKVLETAQSCRELDEISFDLIGIHNDNYHHLFNIFRENKHLRHLVLKVSFLTLEKNLLREFTSFIRAYNQLTYLEIIINKEMIFDVSSFDNLIELIEENSPNILKKISLSLFLDFENVNNFSNLLFRMSDLKYLKIHFDFSVQGDDRFERISLFDAISRHSNMEILSLSGSILTKFGDHGLYKLARCLTKLINLKELELYFLDSSKITTEGMNLMLDVLPRLVDLKKIKIKLKNLEYVKESFCIALYESMIKIKNIEEIFLIFDSIEIKPETLLSFYEKLNSKEGRTDLSIEISGVVISTTRSWKIYKPQKNKQNKYSLKIDGQDQRIYFKEYY